MYQRCPPSNKTPFSLENRGAAKVADADGGRVGTKDTDCVVDLVAVADAVAEVVIACVAVGVLDTVDDDDKVDELLPRGCVGTSVTDAVEVDEPDAEKVAREVIDT